MFVDSDCKFCHYRPCSVDAAICPRCGHRDPNPGIRSRVNGVVRALIVGVAWLFFGGVVAAVFGAEYPLAGVAIAIVVLLASACTVARALWYACDPTMSLLPVRQA
jgi:hypothetical protein